MKVQDQPLMLSAAPTCDSGSIRYLLADLGDDQPIVRVGTVSNPAEVSQDDILELASKLAAAPWLFSALKGCIGYASAWHSHLRAEGNTSAANTVSKNIEDAMAALRFAERYRHSLRDAKVEGSINLAE